MDSDKSRMAGTESNIYPQINPPPYNSVNYPHPQPEVPYGPPPPQGPPTVQVAYVQPGPTITVVSNMPMMGPNPAATKCKSCNMDIVTRVDHQSTTKTHLFALLLCCLGLWPCACIPYCVDSCKSADHYCPNCQAYIGSYRN